MWEESEREEQKREDQRKRKGEEKDDAGARKVAVREKVAKFLQ